MTAIIGRFGRLVHRGQDGVTLVGLLIGLTLSGLLLAGVALFSIQTMTVTGTTNDRMQGITQVENAGFWVGRDVQMSRNATLGAPAGFPLQLAWEDSDGNTYNVTYSENGTTLSRTLVENGGSPVSTLIARDVDTAASSTNITRSGGLLVFDVTAASGDVEVSRSYTIQPRLAVLSGGQ